MADELFAALDGQVVASRGEEWHVRVYGVHSDCDTRGCWLQVHLQGPQELDGTLLVNPERPAAILRTFSGWLRSPNPAAACRTLSTI